MGLNTEDSYRMAGVSQALGIDTQQVGTWTALEKEQQRAIQPKALWGLVQWFGQLSPAQLNLALGVEPPEYIIEDEKHVKECGQKAATKNVELLRELPRPLDMGVRRGLSPIYGGLSTNFASAAPQLVRKILSAFFCVLNLAFGGHI